VLKHILDAFYNKKEGGKKIVVMMTGKSESKGGCVHGIKRM
jgi:hypothetical protein